jgi:hypothetical protein
MGPSTAVRFCPNKKGDVALLCVMGVAKIEVAMGYAKSFSLPQIKTACSHQPWENQANYTACPDSVP